MTESEAYEALHLLNTGMWLQLEGYTGRYIASLKEAGLFVIDEEATSERGATVFEDGYGRTIAQPKYKIDNDVLVDMRTPSM